MENMKRYVTIEETYHSNSGEKFSLTIDEWKKYYELYIDKKEYQTFDIWLTDMLRMEILIEE